MRLSFLTTMSVAWMVGSVAEARQSNAYVDDHFLPVIINGRTPRPIDDQGRVNHLAATTLRLVNDQVSCTSSAIGARCAITALHCLRSGGVDSNKSTFYDRLGRVAGSEETRTLHKKADLAIVKMDAPLAFGRGLSRVQLAKVRLSPREQNDARRWGATVLGYGPTAFKVLEPGRIEETGNDQRKLHHGNLRITGYGVNYWIGARLNTTDPPATVTFETFSADPNAMQDIADGDSGGPLFVNGVLHGINISGHYLHGQEAGAPRRSNGMATSIPDHFDWIAAEWDRLGCGI